MRASFFRFLAHLTNFLRLAILFFILLVLIAFASQFVEDIDQYPNLVKIKKIEQNLSQPFIEQIKMLMPFKYQAVDFSYLILIVFLLFITHLCSLVTYKLRRIANQVHEKEVYYDWRKQLSNAVPKEKLHEIDKKFEDLSTTKPVDRKKILKEFAILKGKLDSMGQQLAFLSIDVVDSTGMKRDEDKYLSAYDFDRYNQLVVASLNEFGVLKYALTPDGLMSCFRTVDDAVQAARTLLNKLKEFNLNEKKIKRSFQIRCGINAGFVYIDDELPLEQVSDRVIDIAGHLQKYAKPDSINIAATAIEPLKNRGGFNESADVIDEQKVYEWNSK